MKNCYIYSFNKEVINESNHSQKQIHLVLFFPYKDLASNKSDLQKQLRNYFHENTLPDKILIIGLTYNEKDIIELFNINSDIFDYIPKFDCNNENSISAISLDISGNFKEVIGKLPSLKEINEAYTIGLTRIFNKNGGLITAQSSHHFVFPSGKHSNQFLRTGNVLLNGTEITFLATALLKHFKKKKLKYIYADTSSINSLAYAYVNLLKELNSKFTESVFIESFSSYSVFDNPKSEFRRDAIFLISSSTSGGILERMTREHNYIDYKDIGIIYGLGVKAPYNKTVICDLTKNKLNVNGISKFESYNTSKEVCKFCEDDHSKPLKVEGDVFLLEKPIVTPYRITINDFPFFLKEFSGFYKKTDNLSEPIIKVFHKEHSTDKKYDIYINLPYVLEEWKNRNDKHPFEPIFLKIEKQILQNIPSSIKYMIVLQDEGSEKLADIIADIIIQHGIKFSKENILKLNANLKEEISNIEKGTIAVISSSIVTGRNLLYLSRALRDFEKNYRRIYFTFLNRTHNKKHLDFLRSNIGLGEFGPDTHRFISVENLQCSNKSNATAWHIEVEFIKTILDFFDEVNIDNQIASDFFSKRLKTLNESGRSKGLSNNLFLPSMNDETLTIRSGFAFAPYKSGIEHTEFIKRACQSEIYFIISTILNDLRNKEALLQSQYSRTIIEPSNFVRFNDGIIQASILRSATNDELDYSLSEEYSLQMQSILGDMISHLKDDHAEALNEFFYALAIKKLKIKNSCLEECIKLLQKQKWYVNNAFILQSLVSYINYKVLIKDSIEQKFDKLPSKDEIINK